jgi:outer membrane protein assembly factor BamB
VTTSRQFGLWGITVVTGLLCTLGGGVIRGADWPNWRGPDHNGISRETGWDANKLKNGPIFLWRKQIGTGFASVTVSDGRAYAMGNSAQPEGKSGQEQKDTLWCFDAGTGAEIWRHTYPCLLEPKSHEGGPSATPTVEAGRVYILSKQGHAFCLDAKKGTVLWQKHLTKDYGIKPHEWGFSGSPIIVDDLIVLNAGTHGLALRKQDGSLAWVNEKGPSGYSSAVPYEQQGKKCVAILGNKEVYGVVAATGQVLWTASWKTMYDESIPDAVIGSDRLFGSSRLLFMSSGLGTGAALFQIVDNHLRRVWNSKEMQNWLSTSILWQGHLYGVDTKDGALKCLDFQTGAVKWAHEGLGVGSVTLAGDKLIALSDKGRLLIAKASPAGYTELAATQILEGKCWTPPVLANGRIYARNADGELVCIDVSGADR